MMTVWGGQLWNCGVIAGVGKNIHIVSGTHPAYFSVCVRGCFTGCKAAGAIK